MLATKVNYIEIRFFIAKNFPFEIYFVVSENSYPYRMI